MAWKYNITVIERFSRKIVNKVSGLDWRQRNQFVNDCNFDSYDLKQESINDFGYSVAIEEIDGDYYREAE